MPVLKTFIIFLISITCLSQEKVDYSTDFAESSLDKDTFIQDDYFDSLLKKSDLSDSWNMTKEIANKDRKEWNTYSHQGIFGEDYHRIDFFIYKVEKSKSNPLLYYITGKTRLKGNICDFNGEIEITDIRMYEHKGVTLFNSDEFPDTNYMGLIVANYKFYEDENRYGSGVFEGKFASGVFINPNHLDKSGICSWNEIDEPEMNGTFVGTWKSYKSGTTKKCIWNYYTDDYPYSGDFHKISEEEKELRAKEISKIETPLSADQLFGKGINPKYEKNGWNLFNTDFNMGWWK